MNGVTMEPVFESRAGTIVSGWMYRGRPMWRAKTASGITADFSSLEEALEAATGYLRPSVTMQWHGIAYASESRDGEQFFCAGVSPSGLVDTPVIFSSIRGILDRHAIDEFQWSWKGGPLNTWPTEAL